MNKLIGAVAGIAMAFAISIVPVSAKTFSFDWVSNDSQVSMKATETLSDSVNSVGGYDIQSIVGGLTVNGSYVGGITGLVLNPNQPFISTGGVGPWNFDNVSYQYGPYLDNGGVLFSIGGVEYNLYTVENGSNVTYYLSSTNSDVGYNPGTPGLISIPELSTWLMILVGFASMGYFSSYKRTPRHI